MAIAELRNDVEPGTLMTIADRHYFRPWQSVADAADRGLIGAMRRAPIRIIEHHELASRRLRRHQMPFSPLRVR